MPDKKRIFLIHGWDGNPENCWFPWLKLKLKKIGYQVIAPAMPKPATPKIGAWINHLKKAVGKPTERTFFVGHSIGCQTILRYLQTLKNVKIGGVILVAGFFNLKNLEDEETENIAKPWLETPIDFNAIKKVAADISVIFSDNDEFVSLEENKKIFEKKLGAKVYVEHDQGHFDDSNGVKKLPKILELLK